MDLHRLQYFLVVARLEHMTKAAQKLHIAQPALSKMIARLEEDIGVPLFERKGRRIRLNAFGKAYRKHVEAALTALAEGKREVQDLAGLQRGRVFVGTPNISCFAEIFGAFLAQYPHVNLRLTQISDETQEKQSLLDGEIDFFITTAAYANEAEFASSPFLTEEILLAVYADHRLVERDRVHLEEVANERFICMKKGHPFRQLTDEFCQQAGFAPHVVCEVDEYGAIGELVQNQIGIAFLTETARKKETALHLLSIDKPICQRTFRLVWMKDRYISRAAQTFRDFLLQFQW